MTKAEILRRAVQAAIKANTPRSLICVPAWASTYSVTQKQVRETWEQELTKVPPSFETPIEETGK